MGVAVYMLIQDRTTPKQLKSPFDPEKFVDFKLKRVEPYNHNTAK